MSPVSGSKGRSRRAALGRILDEPHSGRMAGAVFAIVIGAILTSVAAFYLSSVKSLTETDNGYALWVCEATCVYIFTVEVALRTIVATLDVKRLLLLDPYWWIDVLSIVPFYVELSISSGPGSTEVPGALRVMQLLRLMRILKLMRHYVDMRVLMIALGTAGRALLVPGFAMALCILLLSGALWLAEAPAGSEEDNPDAFDDAFEALWSPCPHQLSLHNIRHGHIEWPQTASSCVSISVCLAVLRARRAPYSRAFAIKVAPRALGLPSSSSPPGAALLAE